MLTIDVEYLTGRVAASAHTDRQRVEWPPHPARLFAALVSVMYESDLVSVCQAALSWLEQQGPPEILCVTRLQMSERECGTTFVPVNDDAVTVGKPELGSIPVPRIRKPRYFASAALAHNRVCFCWPCEDPPQNIVDSLAVLVQRLSYLGRSVSLVYATAAVWSEGDAVAATELHGLTRHVPTVRTGVDFVARVPAPGMLAELERRYVLERASGIRHPLPCGLSSYSSETVGREEVATSHFGDILMMRRADSGRFVAEDAEALARALRRAVLDTWPGDAPEWVSGIDPAGAPSQSTHVAFAAFPDLDHRFARGDVVGVGAVLPRTANPGQMVALQHVLQQVTVIRPASGAHMEVEPAFSGPLPLALRSGTWDGRARTWFTATPVLLDKYPRGGRRGHAGWGVWNEDELAVRLTQSLHYAGLPTPEHIDVRPSAPLAGGSHIRQYRRAKGAARDSFVVHAVVRFSEDVQGPVLVGRGRYVGMGLFRPATKGGASDES
jgi:CRISPR-associated protein Csb2